MRKKTPSIGRSYAVAYSHDGRLLVTIGKEVIGWDTQAYAHRWRVRPLPDPSHIAVSPDSSRVVVKNTSGRIAVLDSRTGATLHDFENEGDGEGGRPTFSEDGQHLIDCTWAGSHVVRALDGHVVFRQEFAPDMVESVSCDAGGRFWFHHERPVPDRAKGVAGERLLGRSWPFTSNRVVEVALPFEDVNCSELAMHPNGRLLAAVFHRPERRVETFEFPAMRPMARRLCVAKSAQPLLRFSPDGSLLAAGLGEGVGLFLGDDLSEVHSWPVEYASDVDFSPDGSHLAIGSWTAGRIVDLRNLQTL